MNRKLIYVVDVQKRVTLGSLVVPGALYSVSSAGLNILLTQSAQGRVKIDGRSRIALGKLVDSGDLFRAEAGAAGKIVLKPLLILDPEFMTPKLIQSLDHYRVG